MSFVGAAGGYPNYSSDHASKYIPKLYSKKLVRKFYAQAMYTEIAQTDYSGEISQQGDTVLIRGLPDVTTAHYVRGMNLDAIRQNAEPSAIELQIDHAEVYSIGLDALDEKQFDLNALDLWATPAAEALKSVIDTDFLANIYGQAGTGNYGLTAGAKTAGYNMGTSASPRVVTKADVLDFIPDAASVLSEQNVPDDEERWMVIPTHLANRIKKSDLRSALFSGDSANATLRSGRIGEIDGFKIFKSNNLTAITGSGSTAVWPVIFGHRAAVTFATQLVKNRTVEPTSTFGKYLEGLQVWGYKVVLPKALGYGAIQVA